MSRTAVVTGASSGIGAAAAAALAAAGYRLVLGARRGTTGWRRWRGRWAPAPCRSTSPIRRRSPRSATQVEDLQLLVNNAGAALGLDRVDAAREELWRQMFELNVLGVLRMTRALLPKLLASGDGHVIVIGSTSGFEVYPGGAGYTASKHALRAVTRTLRLELLGQPVRVTEINPGLVETEFAAGAPRRRRGARPRRSTRGWSRCAPRTSPSASSSRPPARRTATSTRSRCGRGTRPARRRSSGARPEE